MNPFTDEQLRRIEFEAERRERRAWLIANGKLRAPPEAEPEQPTERDALQQPKEADEQQD